MYATAKLPRGAAVARLLLTAAIVIPTAAAVTSVTAGTASANPVLPNHIGSPPPGPAGELYLPEVDSERIVVIDTRTNRVSRIIPMTGGASKPAVMAATPDGSKVYSNNFGQWPPTVTAVDRRNGSAKNIPTISASLGAFMSTDGKFLYVPEESNVVQVVDTRTDKVVHDFWYPMVPVGSIEGPDGLLYVSFAPGFIAAVDRNTGAWVKPPIFTGGTAPFWFSWTKDAQKLYIDNVNNIGVVDMKTWKLTGIINTSPDGVWGIGNPGAFTSTLSPDGSKLYVTMFGRSNVLVVNTKTDRVIHEIPTLGDTPSVIFSGDGTRGYISDLGATSQNHPTFIGETILFAKLVLFGTLGPGQLDVFDPRTDKVLGQIPVGKGPGIPAWVPPMTEGGVHAPGQR